MGRGYFEAITYSFVDPATSELMDPDCDPLPLSNPLSTEMGVMRTSLWPGLLKSLIYNVNRQQDQVRLFELGLCFRKLVNQPIRDLSDISQEMMIAGVACGLRMTENWASSSQPIDFYDVKADLESLLVLSEPDAYCFEKADISSLHPGQAAKISRDDEIVGHIGRVHPELIKRLGLPEHTFMFECRVQDLLRRPLSIASEVSRFPEVRRDIAMLVPRVHSALDITQSIQNVAGEALTNLKLFDVYQGKGIDPNRKVSLLG